MEDVEIITAETSPKEVVDLRSIENEDILIDWRLLDLI